MTHDKFIYGKDDTHGVVSLEVKDDHSILHLNDGGTKKIRYNHWLLYAEMPTGHCYELDGELEYKYAKKFDSLSESRQARSIAKAKGIDTYGIYNPLEAFLVKTGVTYYLGLEPSDLSVLSFDIETTGLTHDENSKVLMISNTYRVGANVHKRLFSIEDYSSDKEMIDAWCKFVRRVNPSVMLGHYIFNFDLPYLRYCSGGELNLGRSGEAAQFSSYTSKFRKDGSQSYDYQNVTVQGRELIDTKFLAIKADTERRYPSYSLKPIIKFEGLEKEGRQHWDFADVSPVEIYDRYLSGDMDSWNTFKRYAQDDADDALALFDLLIPPYFYYARMIPRTLQQIINTASGSQINSFMVRSYLAEKHSIPKATESEPFEGGISFGNPGVYGECYKVDLVSFYPSIIREFKVTDAVKDPKGLFLKMVSIFTDQRLDHKALAKTTGERRFKDLEQAEKIIINSAYGFMGAPGLNFNSPKSAALVTKKGREILNKGIDYCNARGSIIVNADTDSFMFTSLRSTFGSFIDDLNDEFPDMIRWENDGVFSRVLIVKAKNYVLQCKETGEVTIKGSALKATMKEPALREFLDKFMNELLQGANNDVLLSIYNSCVSSIIGINSDNIAQWCSKKTVTKAVLNPKRTNESRVLEAIQRSGRSVNEGDKIHVFFKSKTELSLPQDFDGTYCKETLYRKLFKTVEIFKSVLDISLFPNYALKRNKDSIPCFEKVRSRLRLVTRETYDTKKEVHNTTGAAE